MIGSHNTMTYLKGRRWWARPFARFWRCQDKSISQQINNCTYMFDIRVRKDSKGRWRFCHGIVDLGDMWDYSLPDLLEKHVIKYIREWCTIRLVLERGSKVDLLHDVDRIENSWPQVVRMSFKQPWWDLFNHEGVTVDNYFKPIVTDKPLRKQLPGILRFIFGSPRCYARKHNNYVDHARDNDKYIFIDFI